MSNLSYIECAVVCHLTYCCVWTKIGMHQTYIEICLFGQHRHKTHNQFIVILFHTHTFTTRNYAITSAWLYFWIASATSQCAGSVWQQPFVGYSFMLCCESRDFCRVFGLALARIWMWILLRQSEAQRTRDDDYIDVVWPIVWRTHMMMMCVSDMDAESLF